MTPGAALRPAARALRAVHTAITFAFLLAIAHIWRCALTGRRDRALRVAILALTTESALVTANHGDCPLGPLSTALGDDTPLFELILPLRAARLAVPTLGAITFLGIALVAFRSPARSARGRRP